MKGDGGGNPPNFFSVERDKEKYATNCKETQIFHMETLFW